MSTVYFALHFASLSPGVGHHEWLAPYSFHGGILSIQAMVWVLEHSQSTLGARLTLLAIANHANSRGVDTWPSIALIAKEAHLSERQVHYSIAHLQKIGELTVEHQKGPHGTNMYTLPRFIEGCKICTGGGAILDSEGVQSSTVGGEQTAPEPSLTVLKPNTTSRVWPSELTLTEKLREYAISHGMQYPEFEWERFQNYHLSKGSQFKDWDRAWFTWVARNLQFYGKGTQVALRDIVEAPRGTPRKNYRARTVN